MRVLGRKRLSEFVYRHPDAREWIAQWLKDVEASNWTSPHDVRKRYASASFLGNGRAIFNVRGNRYRLVGQIAYQTQLLVILWIGTHGDYDKQDFETSR